jgi:hypothetical protein
LEIENTTGDQELDAIIYGEDPQGGATPAQANPSEKQTWEAGGRKWDDAGKMAKSYDSLVREFSKTKNENKALKPWGEFGRYLESNPQLRDDLKKRVDEYHANKDKGMSTSAASKDAGIPKEYAEKIERLEAAHADLMLDKEITALQSRYKLDEDGLKEVLRFSEANDGIPLEMAYKAFSYDKQLQLSKESGAKGAIESAKQKKAANVGSSAHSPVAANRGPSSKLTTDQHNAKLSERLDQLGFSN